MEMRENKMSLECENEKKKKKRKSPEKLWASGVLLGYLCCFHFKEQR